MHNATTVPDITRRKVTEIFTRDEIRMLTARSDIRGFIAVGFTWLTICASFVALAWASQHSLLIFIPVLLLALCVLGGRQLSLAIQMHDASHGTLFKRKWLNNVAADWLCARPIWNDLHKYRAHHIVHHTHTGQAQDPDLSLVAPFPTTRQSLARKLLRDMAGVTGIKFFIGRFLMDAGYLKWTVANDVVRLPREGMTPWRRLIMLVRNVSPTVIVNGVMFAVLWASGYPWLFAVWILAYMTTFSLFVRIRSMAEHACTETGSEKSQDMFLNTRTTRAGLLARATVAPLNVNYHIEHHVMASVPYFRLPMMHRMLRERGAAQAPPGYLDVLRIVSPKVAA